MSFKHDVEPQIESLRRAAMRLTRDPVEADDLLQDTLVRAFRFWDSFEEGSNIKAWLFTIMRNTFINGYHRRGRQRSFEAEVTAEVRSLGPGVSIGHSASDPPSPSEAAEASGTKAAVSRALLELQPDQRTAVTLCDLEGYSYKEIAEVMGCPVGTVMSRIYRGRKALHSLLYDHARDVGIVDGAGMKRGPGRSADA